jgi:hypothetical protein
MDCVAVADFHTAACAHALQLHAAGAGWTTLLPALDPQLHWPDWCFATLLALYYGGC